MSVHELNLADNTPLLEDGGIEHADAPIDTDQASEPARPRKFGSSRWLVHSPRKIVLLVTIVKFCIVCSGMMMLLPLYRLLEDAMCHIYYKDDTDGLIDEMKCKEDEVQARLAYLLGWSGLANSVTTLIVAFPYGMLSDRIGRKPTALISYGGVALSFSFAPLLLGPWKQMIRSNPYIFLVGNVWLLFGGGLPVLIATLYSIAADVSTEQEKATSFLSLTFGSTAGGLIGPIIAGILMEKQGSWLPIYIVIFITPFLMCLFLLLPETLTVKTSKEQNDNSDTSLSAFRKHISKGLKDLIDSLSMLKNPNVPIILLTFLFQNARMTAYSSTLVQYISKHFKWRLGETSLLLSPLGALNLLILITLPKVSNLLVSPRFGYTTFAKDLLLTRISTIFIVVGALIEGFSPHVVLFLFGLFITTFGAADSPLARATVSHYVDAQYTSRLYALIGMVEVLGSFIGGPALAFFFDLGLRKKGLWYGLPWFYIAFLSSVALFALGLVRSPKQDRGDETTGSEAGLENYAQDEESAPPRQGPIRL